MSDNIKLAFDLQVAEDKDRKNGVRALDTLKKLVDRDIRFSIRLRKFAEAAKIGRADKFITTEVSTLAATRSVQFKMPICESIAPMLALAALDLEAGENFARLLDEDVFDTQPA